MIIIVIFQHPLYFFWVYTVLWYFKCLLLFYHSFHFWYSSVGVQFVCWWCKKFYSNQNRLIHWLIECIFLQYPYFINAGRVFCLIIKWIMLVVVVNFNVNLKMIIIIERMNSWKNENLLSSYTHTHTDIWSKWKF